MNIRLTAILFLSSLAAFSQTARFPTAIATTADLTDLADRAQTTLSGSLNSSSTSMTVVSASKFAAFMVLTIDNEQIYVTSIVTNTVNGTRGFNGTTAASHVSGALVSNYFVAYQFKAVREEVKAIETALGVSMANVSALFPNPVPVNKGGTGAADAATARTNLGTAKSGANSDITSLSALSTPLTVPQGGTGAAAVTGVVLGAGAGAFAGVTGTQQQFLRVKPNQTSTIYEFANPAAFNVADYAFPAQTPGGSISIGSNSVTLTPCPLGLNGSDTYHYLYISAGTGTAEPVLVTGGTCTSGATTGTIIVTAANTHSGAWTMQSATAGIEEAIVAAGAGGVVSIPTGTYTLRAAVQMPANVTLTGAGQGATTLQVANSALAPTPAWVVAGSPAATAGSTYNCVICFAPGATKSTVSNLTVDTNGANQAVVMFSNDITGYNCTGCKVSYVTVKNHQWGITGSGVGFFGHSPRTSNSNNLIEHASVIGRASCTVPTAGGGYYIEGFMNRIVDTYALNSCDTDYVVALCTNCSVIGGHSDLGSGQSATPMYTISDSYNTVSNSHCTSTGSGTVASCYEVNSDAAESGNSVVFSNNTADHCRAGIDVNNVFVPALFSSNIVFSGGTINCTGGVGVSIIAPASNILVTGMTIQNSTGAPGIVLSSTATAVLSNITITNNFIDHNQYGINIYSPLTDLIKNLTITNNFIGDTGGTPIQLYGIVTSAGLGTGINISGNTLTGNTLAPRLYANTWAKNVILGPNIISTTGDPDYGIQPVWNWSSGGARGRMQSLYSSADASNHDYTYLSENFRHTANDAVNGAVDNAANGTAEVAVKGTISGAGQVILRAGAVNTAPIDVLTCTTAGCQLLGHLNTTGANLDMTGSVTLAAGTGTKTFGTAYIAAPSCVCTDSTANASVKCSATTTVLTVTGTGTDVIKYACFGNPN